MSIKTITHNVVIGQLEAGINKVQSSSIFHTLEAKGYQTLNGDAINIITKQSEITTFEIIESYPKMKDKEHLDSVSHRLCDMSRSNIKDGVEDGKIIFGPDSIRYEEDKITDTSTLDS